MKELATRFNEISISVNARQASEIEKALKKHSFKKITEMPSPKGMKGMKVPDYLNWHQDKEGFYVIMQEVNENDFIVSYQNATAPIVEDVLRNT